MPTQKGKPFLAITLGDPAGCGPWVGVRAAQDPRVTRETRPVLVGDASVLHRFGKRSTFQIKPILSLDEYSCKPGVVNVWHVPHPSIQKLVLGKPQRIGGESAMASVKTAVDLVLAKKVKAVVTGPVSKESFQQAGMPHPGHTEWLASLCKTGPVDMIMAVKERMTLLITRHVPLRQVPDLLTVALIVESVERVDRWMKTVPHLKKMRWLMCGLNPHAGDQGLIGQEEKERVAPAVKILQKRGVQIEGPLPADTAWARGGPVFIASLYHDQGMIPLKVLAKNSVVNITVGLPFVRTSPGHGTAFDLADGPSPYKRADENPTVEACLTAMRLA